MTKKIFFSICCWLFIWGLQAQSYRLESIDRLQHRDQQLLGNYDSTVSFAVETNSILPAAKANWKRPSVTLLPLIVTQQYNSHHPFGWNDGAMIAAKGYQVLARPGINARYGILEVQAAPELVFASNDPYPTNAMFGKPDNQSYTKTFAGQSFIKLNAGPIAVGVSSENLWWGPGIHSSLLMSNNAPGFLHGFIRTNRPIHSPIGNFEFNLIGGNPGTNTSLPYEINHLQTIDISDYSHYLNSYVISWEPKWLKGLYLGMTRSLQQYGPQFYSSNAGFFKKYLPVLGLAVQKANNWGDDSMNTDQLASFFLRCSLPKSNFEFYVEYGFNDYGKNIRDYVMSPSHAAAYTIGIRKALKHHASSYTLLEAEITNMSQSPDYIVRAAGNWYQHSPNQQGYSNENQILGAGAGLGANVQTLTATWINGCIRNGFLLQRIEHDPVEKMDKWTDLSIGWLPQFTYHKMILGAKVQLAYCSNYAWENGNNPLNLHSRLMVQYNF